MIHQCHWRQRYCYIIKHSSSDLVDRCCCTGFNLLTEGVHLEVRHQISEVMATDNHHERAETHRLLYVFYHCNLPNQFSATISRTHENVVVLHHEPLLNGAIYTNGISKIQLTILNVARSQYDCTLCCYVFGFVCQTVIIGRYVR